MSVCKNDTNKPRYSVFNYAMMFLAINCIIVSVLTFTLTAIAVVTNNYDKWFPVAVLLSLGLMFFGRWLLRAQRRSK
ncbi:hypothetical protein ACFO4O_00490 [Glaciecola siphonariae]|uniref:Uncharacterized protein n=1 Tax=Glaciecola siphonariae TaxID=521012 RepID=A0ABV9LSN7_9ALTE